MIRIIIIPLGIFLLAFVVYIIINARRGHIVAKHLHMFEMIYDSDYGQTGSKEVALVNAFRIFSTCPGLKELTPQESRAAIKVIMAAPDPKILIRKIIMKFATKTMLKAFRDTIFLKQLVDIALRYQGESANEQH